MEYVIAQILGRQYLLKKNQYYDFDFLKKFLSEQNKIIYFNKILALKKYNLNKQKFEIQFGLPLLPNIKIPLKFIQNLKKHKLLVLKTKPKKKYTRVKGHKNVLTRLLVI